MRTVDSFWSGAADAAEDYFVFEGAEDYHTEFHYVISVLRSEIRAKRRGTSTIHVDKSGAVTYKPI